MLSKHLINSLELKVLLHGTEATNYSVLISKTTEVGRRRNFQKAVYMY
jgi:hypothetical protein